MRLFTLLLGLFFATPALADDHVVVLLDTSGSMSELMRSARITKMNAAHSAIQKVIDQMPTTTKLGLLTFDGWSFHLGQLDKRAAQQAVSNTHPKGATPLGEYMKMGADELLAFREKEHGVGTYTLLVVTDGEATDKDLMDQYAPDIVSRGLSLKTIGMDLNQTHTLARYSSKYFPANNPASLEGALKQVIAEVPNRDDNIEEDAYAMIAGIPDKMAPDLLQAITGTITFNQPIGEKPKVKVMDPQGNVSFVAPSTTEPAVEKGVGLGEAILILLIVMIIVIMILLIFIY